MSENAHAAPGNSRWRAFVTAPLRRDSRAEVSPDTELLLLAGLLEVNRVEFEAFKLADPLEQPDLAARRSVLLEARNEMVRRLADLRATTVSGERAKASALAACARLDHGCE
jgi:hypothetical protein